MEQDMPTARDMEKEEMRRTIVTLSRWSLIEALNIAADVMQNNAAVAKSDHWRKHYRTAMHVYRETAKQLDAGATFAIKG